MDETYKNDIEKLADSQLKTEDSNHSSDRQNFERERDRRQNDKKVTVCKDSPLRDGRQGREREKSEDRPIRSKCIEGQKVQ